MYKLIASDLDETLLNSKKHVSPLDREAIKKARQAGVRFVCCGGRGFLSMQNTFQEIDSFDKEDEYTVSFNGAVITENKNNRILSFDGLGYEKTRILFEEGLRYGLCIHVYSLTTVYIYGITPDEEDYLRGRMEYELLETPDISFLKDEMITKILFVSTDQDYLHQIENELSEKYEGFEVTYSSNRYIEFLKTGINKGYGLRKLAEYLNIPMEQCIAVGDNFNDYSMLKEAGLGVAVRNAAEGLKPLCDFVTERSCEEGAVAEVIERFVLETYE